MMGMMMGMTMDEYDCQPPCSRGLAFLKQDVGHMRKVRAYETEVARYRAALERAAQVMIDGDLSRGSSSHARSSTCSKTKKGRPKKLFE